MSTKAKKTAIEALLDACLYADWQQVVLNGGPPCFHLDGMTFCLRAERWQGHGINEFHKFVSLHDLMKTATGAAKADDSAEAGGKDA